RRCWYDQDSNVVKTGKYDDVLFVGGGNFADVAEIARSTSLEIPAPFVRLDFLASETGIVFGEITPVPGSYYQFNPEWDSKLGNLFVTAAGRVAADVGYGKEFPAFRDMEKSEKVLVKAINDAAVAESCLDPISREGKASSDSSAENWALAMA